MVQSHNFAMFLVSYTVTRDCSGTITLQLPFGDVNSDMYIAPNGAEFVVVQTDTGSILANVSRRVSRQVKSASKVGGRQERGPARTDRQNKQPFRAVTPATRPPALPQSTTSCSHLFTRPSTPPQPAGAAGEGNHPFQFCRRFSLRKSGSFQIPVDSFSEPLAVIGWQSQP